MERVEPTFYLYLGKRLKLRRSLGELAWYKSTVIIRNLSPLVGQCCTHASWVSAGLFYRNALHKHKMSGVQARHAYMPVALVTFGITQHAPSGKVPDSIALQKEIRNAFTNSVIARPLATWLIIPKYHKYPYFGCLCSCEVPHGQCNNVSTVAGGLSKRSWTTGQRQVEPLGDSIEIASKETKR